MRNKAVRAAEHVRYREQGKYSTNFIPALNGFSNVLAGPTIHPASPMVIIRYMGTIPGIRRSLCLSAT